MDKIRFDIVQQTLVMGNDQEAAVFGYASRSHLRPQYLKGIDIQTGVDLIQNGNLGSSSIICKISLRFFSPPEKPSFK